MLLRRPTALPGVLAAVPAGRSAVAGGPVRLGHLDAPADCVFATALEMARKNRAVQVVMQDPAQRRFQVVQGDRTATFNVVPFGDDLSQPLSRRLAQAAAAAFTSAIASGESQSASPSMRPSSRPAGSTRIEVGSRVTPSVDIALRPLS